MSTYFLVVGKLARITTSTVSSLKSSAHTTCLSVLLSRLFVFLLSLSVFATMVHLDGPPQDLSSIQIICNLKIRM